MTLARRITAVVLCVALAGVIGCAPKAKTDDAASDSATHGGWKPTRTFDNKVARPPAAVQPPPPALTKSPETSVFSYLLWISYAYRILNSDVATMTFSPYEEVRVNSYVQYNKQESRAIDQVLTKLDFTKELGGNTETTVTVGGVVETWKYRYINTRTGRYDGAWTSATYDSTYTVIFDKPKGTWVVDQVTAQPRGDVK